MRDLDAMSNACQHLQLALAFQRVGRLDVFVGATGTLLDGSEDFFYAQWYDIADAVADFFRMGDNEEGYTDYYFSGGVISEYFWLAMEHARRIGLPYKQDPYIREAQQYYYETMLSYCPYSCWFRLPLNDRHEYGCGLAVRMYEGFYDFDTMILGQLDTIAHLQDSIPALRSALCEVRPFAAETTLRKAAA